jgi:hypothetical protein
MKTINSMNIHNIKKVEVSTEVLNASAALPFTVTKYRFTDAYGNVFTVNAFLNNDSSTLDEVDESTGS